MTEKDDIVTEQSIGQSTGQSIGQSIGQTTGRSTRRKVREGLVVSDKMEKTVVVSVEDRVKHALYGKVMRRTSKLKAHDEQNQCGIGDRVLLMETRPLSATKRWRVVEILEKAK
jgi:small subunit ribosomal protein S17